MKRCLANETTPTEQENNSAGNNKENGQESGAVLMFEISSLVSPIILFESGIRLEDLLEPEVKQFFDADINDLMAQIGNQNNENDSNANVVSVNPARGLDGEQNEFIPLSEQHTKRLIDDIFTPKTRGKVRTRGGIRENRGQGGMGILSQSRPRLLTSDDIFNIKKSKKR